MSLQDRRGGLGNFIYCAVIVRDIALKYAPVMSDSCDLFCTVFAEGAHHWISSNDLCNLCLISHVSYCHFVNFAIDFYAHAWIALNICPPPLRVRKFSFQPEILFAAANVKFVAAWGWIDNH